MSPCNAGPRQSSNAIVTDSAAAPASPARSALRVSRSNSSNRSASTAASVSAYPSGEATIVSWPSAARRRAMWCWTALRGAAGRSSPHNASISESTPTTRPQRSASSARRPCRLPPLTFAGRPPTRTSNGPRNRISSGCVMRAGGCTHQSRTLVRASTGPRRPRHVVTAPRRQSSSHSSRRCEQWIAARPPAASCRRPLHPRCGRGSDKPRCGSNLAARVRIVVA